jgi:hypothetical protein
VISLGLASLINRSASNAKAIMVIGSPYHQTAICQRNRQADKEKLSGRRRPLNPIPHSVALMQLVLS